MSKNNQYAMRLELFATAARSDINSRLLTFARPPERRFRRPRLDTVATSATADLMEDVMGHAVRSMILRRATRNKKDRAAITRDADIMTNAEITH